MVSEQQGRRAPPVSGAPNTITFRAIAAIPTIKGRKRALSGLLQTRTVGPLNLSPEEMSAFRGLYARADFSDAVARGETLVAARDVAAVDVAMGEWRSKHLVVHYRPEVGLSAQPISLKRLAGAKKTNRHCLRQAMREAVDAQIRQFRAEHPLDPTDPCPALPGRALGADAEVDHFPERFEHLADRFLRLCGSAAEQDTAVSYDDALPGFVLREPHRSRWAEFHRRYARLRWASKEGNACWWRDDSSVTTAPAVPSSPYPPPSLAAPETPEAKRARRQ